LITIVLTFPHLGWAIGLATSRDAPGALRSTHSAESSRPKYFPKDPSGNEIEDSSALLIFGVAVCCSIESLGKFVKGWTESGRNHEKFKAFLHKYMNSKFQTEELAGITYGVILWRYFRNGLAHGFAVCHGGYEGNAGEPYFKPSGSILEINPTALLEDLCDGFEKYLRDLRSASETDPICRNFNAVFTSVFINGE
jgi:hypothetical protein